MSDMGFTEDLMSENARLKQQLAASEQRFNELVREIEELKGESYYDGQDYTEFIDIQCLRDTVNKHKHSPNSEQKEG